VRFPTGGNSPRASKGLTWCNSKTDSKVWMGEVKYSSYTLYVAIVSYKDIYICNYKNFALKFNFRAFLLEELLWMMTKNL